MKKINKIIVAGLVILGLFLAAVPSHAALEIRGQAANETKGIQDNLNLSSGTVSWYQRSFTGYFYELDDELGSENLTILNSASLINNRTIASDKLIYSTSGDNKMLNAVKYPFDGNYTAAEQAGLIGFQAGSMSSEDGKYKVVGWKAEKWVAIKNHTNKLSKLVLEQRYNNNKTLSVGKTWNLGAGYELTVNAIDARAAPRQAWFSLKKDGALIDEIIMTEGQIYTYVKNNLLGETNVPVFVTYADEIFSGPTSDNVRLKYTWLIDTGSAIEVKTGDSLDIFTVTKADESIIRLRNSGIPVMLVKGSIVKLIGNLNFKVSNTDTLRFYPFVDGGGRVHGTTANETTGQKGNLDLSSGIVSWQSQNFPGFFYELEDEPGSEELTIIDSASLIGTRTISPEKLVYSTSGDNRMLNVVRYPFNGNYTAAEQAGLGGFQAGSMSSQGGKYSAVGFQGDKFVGIKNKTNKLSRPIIEHFEEKKTLMTGETWALGAGFELTIEAIDARTTPRQVWFSLKKNGSRVDDKILTPGKIYTYVEQNMAGESNVPVLVTYVDSIFSGNTTDMVQFRYTWLIDTNVTQVRTGDLFGVLKVTVANSSTIVLKNTDYPILLNRDASVYLMGSIGFKVADSDTLRFYPERPQAPTCQYSMINGHMFEDNNVNGVQDAVEPGMFNRTVSLAGTDICSNVSINMNIPTDASGYYEFRNIRAGTYFLYEDIPAGSIPTTPGIYKIILPFISTNITKDFGNFYPGSG